MITRKPCVACGKPGDEFEDGACSECLAGGKIWWAVSYGIWLRTNGLFRHRYDAEKWSCLSFGKHGIIEAVKAPDLGET